MSIISEELSIISVGCSCQVTHNLDLLKEDLSIYYDQQFKRSAQYFDYIISPVHTVTSFLHKFPELKDKSEIELRCGVPYWSEFGIEFSHNFRNGGSMIGNVDIENEFEFGCKKINYLRGKWLRTLAEINNGVFVIGNSQPNLRQPPHLEKYTSSFIFDYNTINSLYNALRSVAGKKLLGLLVVESDETDSGPWHIEGVVRRNVGPSGSEWTGDKDKWNMELKSGLSEILQYKPQSDE